jgi:hypothetical protein
VGRHATSALYNAVEHRRIPMRFIWMPIAKVQEGLGGKARAITYGITTAVLLLIGAMIFVPYPLKMKAKGVLLPHERQWVYTPMEGQIVKFLVEPNEEVQKGQHLVLMRSADLQAKIAEFNNKIQAANHDVELYTKQFNQATDPNQRGQATQKRKTAEDQRTSYQLQLNSLQDRVKADDSVPGGFVLESPIDGEILNYDYKENLKDKFVKPSDQILRIGNVKEDWEIEVKIPQKYFGHVKEAFSKEKKDELDVSIVVLSSPTRTFKGKLSRNPRATGHAVGGIGGEAVPNLDDKNESEPVVKCWVRIDGKDIPESDRLPRDLLTAADVEAEVKIHCGNRPMGYSLFHGIWEYFYEKVVFFF